MQKGFTALYMFYEVSIVSLFRFLEDIYVSRFSYDPIILSCFGQLDISHDVVYLICNSDPFTTCKGCNRMKYANQKPE